MKRKRFKVQTAEERAEQERRSDAPQRQPDCREAQVDAEIAGHKPGAAGLTVRSRRPKC
jgi:hypothetical protein